MHGFRPKTADIHPALRRYLPSWHLQAYAVILLVGLGSLYCAMVATSADPSAAWQHPIAELARLTPDQWSLLRHMLFALGGGMLYAVVIFHLADWSTHIALRRATHILDTATSEPVTIRVWVEQQRTKHKFESVRYARVWSKKLEEPVTLQIDASFVSQRHLVWHADGLRYRDTADGAYHLVVTPEGVLLGKPIPHPLDESPMAWERLAPPPRTIAPGVTRGRRGMLIFIGCFTLFFAGGIAFLVTMLLHGLFTLPWDEVLHSPVSMLALLIAAPCALAISLLGTAEVALLGYGCYLEYQHQRLLFELLRHGVVGWAQIRTLRRGRIPIRHHLTYIRDDAPGHRCEAYLPDAISVTGALAADRVPFLYDPADPTRCCFPTITGFDIDAAGHIRRAQGTSAPKKPFPSTTD